MPRLLLINPRFPESFWSFRWALQQVLPGKRAINPPLGLATLAALCPPDWQVTIVDENVESVPLDPAADLIGICGMGVQYARQSELLRYYRDRGHYVVAGGSYASLCPERYQGIADTVISGEAEYIWPRFCADFTAGTAQPLYREEGTVDLADSPTPRFDLLKLNRYTNVGLQFSRGCPFHCEFCDIIVMFGRRQRSKTPEQIGRELDLLRAQEVRSVFFVDDNLIGHHGKVRELLHFLIDYQRRHDYPFSFGTEVSMNLAGDDELLDLFRQARFGWVFIGIESPDPASLRETGKTQNLRKDLLGSLHHIYAHGIDVMAGFIVGFDNDTLDTFARQERFIGASGIQVAMVGLLTALPRTPLYERLQREGRLLCAEAHEDNTRAGTNFRPRNMEYDAMVAAYRALFQRLTSDRGIALRIRHKARSLRRPASAPGYARRERLTILLRLLRHGILPGGPRRWFEFLRTVPLTAPCRWPSIIGDWIAGLSIRDYVERKFQPDPARAHRLGHQALAQIRRQCAVALRQGTLQASLALSELGAELGLTLRGAVDARFFTSCADRIERMLQRTPATVSVRIEELAANQREHLEGLLRQLARFGDRISIHVSAAMRPLLPIDSSVFNVVLSER
ncbi:MAG: B12-binding domain-containing radical SAM protein [Gammaproteobacteria bacterium]|nr:B12-binding domain-containing radical SAM protein [Gammaproteobacteria bacterium]